jgi:hypothetical protein
LQHIWVAAPSDLRDSILKAWHQIDDTLARDPEDLGESRDEGMRIWFEAPLGILFKVAVEKKQVRLLQVWTFAKRS